MECDPKECLYISDLDGTLLEPDSRFPAESVRRLNRLIDRGLKFTIATARSYDSTHPILREVNFRLPVILFNGVYLTHFHNGENLHLSNFIRREVVQDVLNRVLPRGIDPFVYTYGERHRLYYRRADNPGSLNYLQSLEGDGRLRRVLEYEFMDHESIAGVLLIDRHEVLDPVHKTLSEDHPEDLNLYFAEDIAMPGYYWLQMFHRAADKGGMVCKLAEHVGIPLSRVVVFGDYLNDLSMFATAGRAIAVENALPEVKQAADLVIGPNAHGAVLDYLESLGF